MQPKITKKDANCSFRVCVNFALKSSKFSLIIIHGVDGGGGLAMSNVSSLNKKIFIEEPFVLKTFVKQKKEHQTVPPSLHIINFSHKFLSISQPVLNNFASFK